MASQYDIFTVGAGYLDVWSALNSFDVATRFDRLSHRRLQFENRQCLCDQ